MAALRAGDQLVNQTTPTSFGWSDILIEQLAISRDEYRLFTDPALQLGDLYGLPEASALADLQAMSLQDLSRRLDVSYDDLTAIVATRFINPNAALIPRLQQLDAPFATLQALHDTLNTPQSIAAGFISALPAGLDATQYGGTSPGRLPGGGGLGDRARRLPADHGHHHHQRAGRDHRRLLRGQLPAPLLQPGQHRQPAQRDGLPEAHPLHPPVAQARAAARRRQRRGVHPAHRRRHRRPLPGRRRARGHQRRHA